MMLITEHFIYFTEKTYLWTLLYICLFYFIIFLIKKKDFKCYAVTSSSVLGLPAYNYEYDQAGSAEPSRMCSSEVV